jgi:hypothetical protein
MSRIGTRALTNFLILAEVVACMGITRSAAAQQPKEPATNRGAVQTEMRNVMYHFTDQVSVHILGLEGKLVPQKESNLPIFDDPRSFTLAINSADISMRTDSLTHVLNQYVFSAPDSPVKDIAVTIQGSFLKVKGKLHSKGDVPFETEGTVGATQDGQIRIQARKIRAVKVPVKGLMDLLGLKLANLINTKGVTGVRVEGDNLVLDPQQILPPPHIQGWVTGVRLADGEIVLTFGVRNQPGEAHTGNYMAYHGAQLRFGKLAMSDADLILIDMNAKDPFDFYLDHYKEQLVAGYTKETLNFGLQVYMRDYNKLAKQAPKKTSAYRASPTFNRKGGFARPQI